MNGANNFTACFANKVTCGRSLRACLALGLFVALGPAAPARGDVDWIGGGGDNLWSNPDNWLGGAVPTSAERAKINGPDAQAPNGPVIQDGIEAVTEILISDAGTSNMTMTGGSLELTGWGMWWADSSGTTATFNMSGGVVDLTGSPGVMELGWQEAGDPIGGSVGTWTMTGGEVNAQGVDMPGKNNGGMGVINLRGGTLNVGTSRGGLILYEGALIDITEGLLVLEGDQSFAVEDYIDNGWMTAYSGRGDLSVEYDGAFTTVSALPALRLEAGDANQDLKFDQIDLVQVQIAAKYLTGQPATWGQGDWDGAPGGEPGNPPPGDGQFNQLDIIAALGANTYLTGPYAAVKRHPEGSGNATLVYNPGTGELSVQAGGTELTSINIDSAAAIFTGEPAMNLGGSFDNDSDNNIFKATFGSSFGSLSFGNVAQSGLSEEFVLNDLTVIGSLAGGGDLGEVDLIYVPEPGCIGLMVLGLVVVIPYLRVSV